MNKITQGRDCFIHPKAEINVDELILGDFSKVNAYARISGRRVVIGREAWIDKYAYIGGGRAGVGELKAGDFLHLGEYSQLNTADKLTIGDEVGVGINTKIFTHGAYLSEFEGFPCQKGPVTIGNRVWLPNAWVNPKVDIGNDVVVCAMSLVNRDLPSGCLAGGVPVKIIKEGIYPRVLKDHELLELHCAIIQDLGFYNISPRGHCYIDYEIDVDDAVFNYEDRTISGSVSKHTEITKNVLRRHGIRFKYFNENGIYRSWNEI